LRSAEPKTNYFKGHNILV